MKQSYFSDPSNFKPISERIWSLGLPTCDSTHLFVSENKNIFLKNMINCDALMVYTNHQTGGIGRYGKSWISPDSGLYTTWLLKRDQNLWGQQPQICTIGLAAACCEFLKKIGLNPRLKWPNDVWLDDCKLAGVLASFDLSDPTHLILSIGINLKVSSEQNYAGTRKITGIYNHSSDCMSNEVILKSLWHEFSNYWTVKYPTNLMSLVDQFNFKKNTKVQILQEKSPIMGYIWNVNENGLLQLRLDDGKIIELSSSQAENLTFLN